MARLNIEDCWWSDPRRTKLLLKIGFATDSAAVSMWRTAQEFWGHGRRLVPKSVWASVEHGSDLLAVGLAREEADGFYVCGSSQYLDWLVESRDQAREAGKVGGKKSVETRRKRYGTAEPRTKRTRSEHEATTKRTRSGTKPSSSSSSSSSVSRESKNSVPSELVPAVPTPTPVGVYVSAYQEKYGHRPEVGPREGKILTTFAKNHPDRWAELIRGYLEMPDTWSVSRSHPVEPLSGKVNEIGRFLETGKVVTKKVREHVEEMIDKAQGTNRKPRRSLEEIEAERKQMLIEAGEGK